MDWAYKQSRISNSISLRLGSSKRPASPCDRPNNPGAFSSGYNVSRSNLQAHMWTDECCLLRKIESKVSTSSRLEAFRTHSPRSWVVTANRVFGSLKSEGAFVTKSSSSLSFSIGAPGVSCLMSCWVNHTLGWLMMDTTSWDDNQASDGLNAITWSLFE